MTIDLTNRLHVLAKLWFSREAVPLCCVRNIASCDERNVRNVKLVRVAALVPLGPGQMCRVCLLSPVYCRPNEIFQLII